MPQVGAGFPDVPGQDPTLALGLIGPTLYVDIGFDPGYKPGAGPETPPVAGIKQIWALVDTGAQECCIDAQLAVSLGLPVVDQKQVCGSAGAHTVSIYLAQIHVPALTFTVWGQFAGIYLAAGGQRHQALLGRSFLQRFTMTYVGNTGEVTISGPN